MRQARDLNYAELRLGKLGVERASSPDVKQTATKMVQKHGELQAQLDDLSRQHGVTAPPALSTEQQATYDRLKTLSGPEFDTAFKKAVADIHKKELALDEGELAHGTDPALRGFAQSRVMALKQSMSQPS